MPPPDLPVYFIDRDLGRHQFAAVLEKAGLQVRRHADHFADDAPDIEWLSKIGEHKWVALTHDRNISRNSLEVLACMNAGVKLFVLRGKATAETLAKNFILVESRVRKLIDSHDGPFIAKVFIAKDSSRKSLRNAVELYLTPDDLRTAPDPSA